jgi:hypothetical protein
MEPRASCASGAVTTHGLHSQESVSDVRSQHPDTPLNTYQPAGRMEEFFREVGRFSSPPIHEVLGVKGLQQLFQTHGMEMVQPLIAGWAVDDDGRITRVDV